MDKSLDGGWSYHAVTCHDIDIAFPVHGKTLFRLPMTKNALMLQNHSDIPHKDECWTACKGSAYVKGGNGKSDVLKTWANKLSNI